MAEVEYGCSPCSCPPICQDEISKLIYALLNHCKTEQNVNEIIDAQTFIFICHKVIDTFMKVGTVEYVHDPEGMAIFGDLHGNFSDLMKGMMRTGWPTERTLIFMGDYVDRGKRPLQIHQLYWKDNYPFLYENLQFAFDYIPLAAIISDQIYCCHGGVSQFSKSLQDVAGIERPINCLSKRIYYKQIAIMTDTVWSDPTETPAQSAGRTYIPHILRGCSYYYTQEALFEKLRQYRVRAVVRGHQINKVGYHSCFNGRLITIHSTGFSTKNYEAAILTLRFNPINGLLSGVVMKFDSGECDLTTMINYFVAKFVQEEDKGLLPMRDVPRVWCQMCRYFSIPSNLVYCWRKPLTHYNMYEMVLAFKKRSAAVQNYFDWLAQYPEDVHVSETARQFPFLMQALTEQGLLTMAETMVDDRPKYDFSKYLPEDPEYWPPLIVGEEYGEEYGRLSENVAELGCSDEEQQEQQSPAQTTACGSLLSQWHSPIHATEEGAPPPLSPHYRYSYLPYTGPGPIYDARKCNTFGVCVCGRPRGPA